MKRAILLALLVAGCNSTPKERIVIQEVRVPISVPCSVDIPPRQPREGDAVTRKSDILDLAKAVAIDLARAEEENVKLRARLTGCVAPPDT